MFKTLIYIIIQKLSSISQIKYKTRRYANVRGVSLFDDRKQMEAIFTIGFVSKFLDQSYIRYKNNEKKDKMTKKIE